MPQPEVIDSTERKRSFTPTSPTSNYSPPNKRPKYPLSLSQAPVSPPLSNSPSNIDESSSPSPRMAVLTPASMPMSADNSQQGFASSSYETGTRQSAGLGVAVATTTGAGSNNLEGSCTDAMKTPIKRKLEDSAEDLDSSKRQKTDISQAENPTNPSNSPKFSKSFQSPILVHKFRHEASQPPLLDPSSDLLAGYGLANLAASVARKDLVTGAKIVKLRKSYEGHIKDLEGRNKAISVPGELTALMTFPSEEWQAQKVSDHPVQNRLTTDLLSKLELATTLGAAKLSSPHEDEKWKSLLMLEDQDKKVPHAETTKTDKARKSAPSGTHPPIPESMRPQRRGTKRRYDDESFEGYGEGYVDDSHDDMSMGGDDDSRSNVSRRKRRKESSGSPHFSAGISNYNTPVSVGNGGYVRR